MADVNEWNTQIIAEFRANEGRVGGPFEGQPVVLIHHKGRRSGAPRVNPVVYQKVDGGWAVFASYAGAPKHPDWYFNLMDEPRTTIEIGTETLEVVARDTSGAERDEIWEKQKAASPGFADYEVKAGDRVIPVVVLEPAG
jgi:deazaflavin-dependent oxidoreductase (nitroreductase family)